jgi:hypothetical protein
MKMKGSVSRPFVDIECVWPKAILSCDVGFIILYAEDVAVASPEFGSVFRSANYKVNLITSIIGVQAGPLPTRSRGFERTHCPEHLWSEA